MNRRDFDSSIRCVPFVPFRCPNCGKHKPFTYGVHGKMRYHKCGACGEKYRSWELSAGDVRGWGEGDLVPPDGIGG